MSTPLSRIPREPPLQVSPKEEPSKPLQPNNDLAEALEELAEQQPARRMTNREVELTELLFEVKDGLAATRSQKRQETRKKGGVATSTNDKQIEVHSGPQRQTRNSTRERTEDSKFKAAKRKQVQPKRKAETSGNQETGPIEPTPDNADQTSHAEPNEYETRNRIPSTSLLHIQDDF